MDASGPPATRLGSPRFLSFLATQFLGAANDNAFKITLTLLVLARLTDEVEQVRLNSLATALFPLPFLLFAPLAGYLADRFSKQRMLVWTKAPEVLAMTLAIPALAAGHLPSLLAVLFLMAAQSAFFSPVKYGLLPESLATSDLSMANGWLQLTTNVAILSGSVAGVVAFDRFADRPAAIGAMFLTVALLGLLASLYVPRTPAGNAATVLALNPVSSARANWREARRIPVLFHTLFGIAFFGFIGALFMAVVPVFGKNVLRLSETGAGLLMLVLALGLGAGSVVAGKLSRRRVEIGLVPIGALGLAVFSTDLALFAGPAAAGGWPLRALVDLAFAGLAAGLFIVPLNALLQDRSPEGMKGQLIAFSNLLTFTAVLIAAGVPWLLTGPLGLGVRAVILAGAALSLGSAVYIVYLVPDFLVRLVLLVLTRTLYRVRVAGEENIPRRGGLLVANHVSYADALLIGSACGRMIRFMMFRPFYEARGLRWFFQRMHVIPIAAGDPPELKEASLEAAREQIRQGHLVCIFAEGAITRTGNLLKFKRGFERIAEGLEAPIVPVCLDGMWGSLVSWEQGRLLFKRPPRQPSAVQVLFGKPLPSSARANEVREAVQELSVTAFELRKPTQWPLEVELLRTARRFWSRPFVADSSGRRLRFGEALTRALALRRACGADGVPEGTGVLLPPGIDAMLANLALLCSGRVLVNLESAASAARLGMQIRDAGIERVLTSRNWLEACGGAQAIAPARPLFVEELLPHNARGSGGSLAVSLTRVLPLRLAARLALGRQLRQVDATAAVVFSPSRRLADGSGGVMLSHHNILSNLESLKQVFRVSRQMDRITGLLPFSSAFGLSGTLLLPAVVGVPVSYHTDPLDADVVGRMVERDGATLLPATPTHLAAYLDAVEPTAFRTLREVVVAAERFPEPLRERFAARFGVEPLEGFGCAECSPLVSLNVPPLLEGRTSQISHRPGTSGHPLPGVAVRIVEETTGRPLPPGEIGRLMVKGPNVMQGYLKRPDLTCEVLEDGWYRTEYRASMDEDGFLSVLDLPEPGAAIPGQ